MSIGRRTLACLRYGAAFACIVLGCGDSTTPPGDDASNTQGSGSAGTSTSTATASSGADSSSTGPGLPTCDVGDYECEEGYGCSQFDTMSQGYCEPLGENGCIRDDQCPEGLLCHKGSHHSEIGSCQPIEAESSGSSGGSSGSSGGSSGSSESGSSTTG